MSVSFRPYAEEPGFTPDFHRVHDFLVRINRPVVTTENFLWGRWQWMLSHSHLQTQYLGRIGTWEDDGSMVGLATYETGLGDAWFCVAPGYSHLKAEMLAYAEEHLSKDGKLRAMINDSDAEFQSIAARRGYRPTQEKECTAVIPIDEVDLAYALPEGFRIVSLADAFDMKKYHRVMWRGFNHGEDVPETPEHLRSRAVEVSGPHVNLDLKVAVQAPGGEFVSYCGMWYLPGTGHALVEPVATAPAYRMKGLGKAAVLEGVRRCGKLGAKTAYVGSSQQFYYNIGFRPCSTERLWERS